MPLQKHYWRGSCPFCPPAQPPLHHEDQPMHAMLVAIAKWPVYNFYNGKPSQHTI